METSDAGSTKATVYIDWLRHGLVLQRLPNDAWLCSNVSPSWT